MQLAQSDLPAALKSYRDALAIRQSLAQDDPGNLEWQRDVSVSHRGSATCNSRMAIWKQHS